MNNYGLKIWIHLAVGDRKVLRNITEIAYLLPSDEIVFSSILYDDSETAYSAADIRWFEVEAETEFCP